jgi:hypothetical protein
MMLVGHENALGQDKDNVSAAPQVEVCTANEEQGRDLHVCEQLRPPGQQLVVLSDLLF